MRQQMMCRDRAEFGCNGKAGKILQHRPVQVELAFIVQLQCHQRHKRLGDRADLKEMILAYRNAPLDVGKPVACGAHGLVRIGHAQGHSRCVHRSHIRRDVTVQVLFRRGRGQWQRHGRAGFGGPQEWRGHRGRRAALEKRTSGQDVQMHIAEVYLLKAKSPRICRYGRLPRRPGAFPALPALAHARRHDKWNAPIMEWSIKRRRK